MNTKIFEDNILSRNDIAVRYVGDAANLLI